MYVIDLLRNYPQFVHLPKKYCGETVSLIQDIRIQDTIDNLFQSEELGQDVKW